MSRFFIDRPIFAWVIAIIIMLAGGLAITQLPISMYPDIAPPSVTINANYPGASAQVVEDSVTQIIEQNMKGLDGLIYISATSEASGSASISWPSVPPKDCGAALNWSSTPASKLPPVAIRWSRLRWQRKANASSPTIAACPIATACGWLAARTWAARAPSCARTR